MSKQSIYSKVIRCAGLPPLKVTLSFPRLDEEETYEYMVYNNVVPIQISLWEHDTKKEITGSDQTRFWLWVLHYPGIDLNTIPKTSPEPGGVGLISKNGLFGCVDGGNGIDINNPVLQQEVLGLLKDFLMQYFK